MKLHQLPTFPSDRRKAKRVGRGIGSWKGTYSTRWLKGQKARSWSSSPGWFEWNQTSLFMRLPKLRWFTQPAKLRTRYVVFNVSAFDKFDKWTSITKEFLIENKWIVAKEKVKILGNGEITKSLSFDWIDAVSWSARTKIEAAWGSIS